MREAFGVDASDGGDAIKDGLVVENLETGVGGGTGERVPGVGMAMIESVKAIFAVKGGFDAVGAEGDAHGEKSTGDAFGDAHQVGNDVGEIAGKHFSSAAETGEHFVGDQQNIMTRAECADFLQEFDGVNDHATSALEERLNDYGSDLIAAFSQELFELLGAFDVARLALKSDGTAIAIGGVHAMDGITHGAERLGERRFVADGHGAGGVAMVAVRERDDFAFVGTGEVLEILDSEF